jgi:hypothetical protein
MNARDEYLKAAIEKGRELNGHDDTRCTLCGVCLDSAKEVVGEFCGFCYDEEFTEADDNPEIWSFDK